MKNDLRFTFDVNKETNEITVVREFAAPKDKVWAAWTTAEILDKWWAPKPYRAVTKELDFRESGHWLYSMRGPEGDVHWCRADYTALSPGESFSSSDTFCDENGNPTDALPEGAWTVSFESQGDHTLVHIHISYKDLQSMEKILEMGFRGGFTMGLGNLDEVLAA